MTRKFTKLMAALALLVFMTPTMAGWGQTREDLVLTFPLTSNPGGWPTSNSTTLTNYDYELDGVTYTFALKNVKQNSGYLMLTSTAVLGLPAIENYKLTQVIANNSSSCSTSTKVGISSSADQANYIDGGAIQTWSTTSSSYTYNLTSTDANTMYYMYVTNKNAQVTQLQLTYTPVSSNTPSITISGMGISNNAVSFDWNNTADHTASVVYQNLDEREAELCLYETYENGVCSNKVTNMSNYWLLAMFGDNDEVITYAATNANGSANDRTVYMRVEAYDGTEIYSSNVIAITQAARPTYTVTYNCNGGTSGCPENVSGVLHGASITLAAAPTKTDYIFNGWSDGTTTYQAGDSYTVTGDVIFTAQWIVDPNAPQYEWVETALADLGASDVFVIVGDNGDTYTMTNDNGTSDPPTANSVTIVDGKLSAAPSDNLKWNISGNASDGYTFYPNGSTSTWLYCNTTSSSSNNNNMRVGTGARKLFVLDDDNYLLTKDDNTGRYVSIYQGNNGSDWRGYINTTTAPTTVTFYKRQQVSTDPFITLDEEGIEAPGTGKEGYIGITYGNFPDPELISLDYYFCDAEGNDLEEGEDPDWIDAELVTENGSGEQGDFLHYTISANDGAARTAYAKVYIDEDDYYSIVTFSQAAAPQQYTLTVSELNANIDAIYVYNAADQTNALIADGLAGNAQVLEGTSILVSPVVASGYVLESLTVDGVDVTSQLDASGAYTFTMPSHAVTITATATEYVAPVVGKYVRITSLDDLKDGCKVIIAARYDEEVTDYYAMPGTASGKPNGVAFTSETSGDDEILPADITSSEDDYYWTVNVTNDGYTFTNAEDKLIGYGTSGTDFTTGGSNIEWTISRETAGSTAMVGGYTGFVIRNGNTDSRAFAFNGTAFGPYSTQNMDKSGYNFFLDFFVETYTKDIEGNQWYFIASPVGSAPTNMEDLSDLYYYDEQDHYWRNKKNDANADGFDFAIGTGYLCANANLETTPDPITLTFIGAPIANEVQEITLSYNETTTENEVNTLAGWNLVGNPFNDNATLDMDCYILSGTAINTTAQTASSYTVGPCEGVMVKANEDGQLVTFTKATPGQTPQPNQLQMTVAQQVVTRNGASTGSATVEDNAIVSFNEGNRLEKFAFNADAAKLYIPQNGKEYAIVSAEAQGEMPVNFRAAKNGTYTLTINPEGVEMNYLHLIDNMTGANIDLLQTPSYTFNASMNDYESRFKLVFAAGSSTGSEASETFAFFANDELIVSNEGEATLQVVDMTGRILSSQALNGNGSVQMAAPVGVYVLRLISGNEVKTQKIVVR